MSEMLDRIRKELHQRGGYETPWESCSQCEDAGRAILELMSEPTKAMIDAGYDVDYSPDPLPTDLVWKAMIAEALK